MRPDSIRKFDIFFLASVAMSVASALLNYDGQVEALTREWEPMGLGDSASTFILGAGVLGVAVNLLLWFLASRLRQGWVKWVLAIFVAITVLTSLTALSSGFGGVSITGLVTVLLRAIAVYFLFQVDAREWFAGK